MGDASISDISMLSELSSERVLSILRARYLADVIYTYVGDILIAVNPHKPMTIYGSVLASHVYCVLCGDDIRSDSIVCVCLLVFVINLIDTTLSSNEHRIRVTSDWNNSIDISFCITFHSMHALDIILFQCIGLYIFALFTCLPFDCLIRG